MKKVAAIITVFVLVLSLFACSSTDSGDTSETVSAISTDSVLDTEVESSVGLEQTAQPDNESSEDTSLVGYYDPNYDYNANPTYKVVYMTYITGVIYDLFSKAFGEWSNLADVEFSDYCSNNDNDLFITTIETYAAQGVNGFLFDGDNTIYPRINELMNELELPYMTCLAQAFDDDGNRCHPFVGFENTDYGVLMAEWVIDYANENWTDAQPGEIAMISLDFSVSPQIHDRTVGAQEIWNEVYPDYPDSFFIADGVSTQLMNAETAYNLVGPILSANAEYKYWLFCACCDDYADGAVRAAEQAGMVDNYVATACGGAGLINHWDAGESSAWKSSAYTAHTLFSEPMFFALYAFMSGQATPETIYPDWIDHSTGQTYAYVMIPSFVIEEDNYKEYMEWVDSYTGINWSPYDDEYNGTQFDAKVTPPDYYAG